MNADDVPVVNVNDDCATETYVSTNVGRTIGDLRTTGSTLTIPDPLVIAD